MSTEVASLKIKVDTSDTVKATNDLNKLTNTAKSTEKQTQSLTSAFFSLKGAIATLGVAQTAQYFVKTADSMNLLNARLKLTTSSTEEYISQQKKLLEISKSSYTSISDTVTLYTKLDPALKQLGASTSQVNSVVESFSKGLQLGGASAQESSSAILQFAQAMGSGVLRGEEFNAMAEASPKLMKYLADGLGVPQTALRKMAENGELTALRVSNALLKMKSDIDRDFVTLPVTVAKATTNAMTDLSLGISDIDSAIGITKGLATAITELSSNIGTYSQTIISFYQETAKFIQEHNEALDTTGTILKTVAAAYIGFAVTSGIVTGIGAITTSVLALRTSILLLQTSIPIIGWVAAAVGAAAGAYVLANDMLDESNDAQSISIDKLKAKIDELEKRKAGLAQNKFKESNEKTINIELEALKSKLKLQEEVNRKDIARAEDVIPKEKTAVTELVGEYDGAFKKIDEIKNEAKGKWEDLSNATKKAIDPIRVIRDEYEAFRKDLKEKGQDNKENLEALNKKEKQAIKDFNDKANKEQIDAQKDKQKELERLEKEHQENIKKVTQDAKDMITSDVQKLSDEYVKMYEVVKDTLSPDELNALNAAYQKKAEDLAGVTELVKQAQEIITSEIDKVNDKYMKMYDVIKDNPMFSTEDMQIFFEKWNKELDDLKPKLDYSKSIKLDTEGDNRAVAKITKGFDELNDATKQYQSNRAKATKGSKEEAENEEQFRKDQINGYANISSAMADMFEKGSKEAATFQAASTALALVEATRAILTQGTGDPYTAIPRMVAMAAMVGSLMRNIGVAFGMNKTTTSISSDSASSQIANTGTGTSLGDKAKQSESITKSLEILEDFAKPQYRITQQMAASLQSIDQKMGGVSALLVRTGGFAFGEGFTPSAYDSGWKNKVGGTVSKGLNWGAMGASGGMTLASGGIAGLAGFGLSLVDSLTGSNLNNLINKIPIIGDLNKLGGKVTSSILGGLFGKSSTTVSTKLTDSGIYFADQLLGDAINEIYGSAYQTIQKKTTTTKKSWFGSSTSTKKKSTTYFEDMAGFTETERQFSLVLKSIYDSVSLAGEALGESSDKIDSQLNSFVVSIGKISLKGLTGTQIQDTLTAIFGRIGDQLANATFPALVEFQAVGEGLYTTLTRVASGIEQADYYTDRLGKSFEKIIYTDIMNKQGDVGFEALYQSIVKADEALYGVDNNLIQLVNTLSGTAEELYNTYRGLDLLRSSIKFMGVEANALGFASIKGAGGIEELANGVNSYLENFLSDTEQLAFQTQLMSDEFAKLGLAMPTSKEGFTNLIKSLDVSSESGQELYGRLIILSDSFAKLFENTSSSKASLLENISSFVKDLLGTTVTASSGTTFKTFADSFNNMIDAIAKGSSDLESIGQTTLSTAQAYIDTVSRTASTSAEVQFAKKVVANKLSSVVNAPDITLGTINDTLKISFNENSAIVNELKQMRTQLEYLNGLNTTQTATQLKTLSATRALIS